MKKLIKAPRKLTNTYKKERFKYVQSQIDKIKNLVEDIQ